MIDQIDAGRPKVPIYEDLPAPVKSAILAEGEKQFVDQVSNNKEAIAQQALAQFNPQNLGALFGQLNPESILQSIVGGAGGQFLSNLGLGGLGGVAGNLLGGGGSGGIGGMAGNLIGGGGIGSTLGNIF